MIKPRKAIEKLEAYNPPIENRGNSLRMDFNENTVGPSPKVVEAIKNISRDYVSCYPEYNAFKKKLAKYLRVKESQVIPTNASDDGIKVIMDTYIEEGDEIIIPEPTFPMFRIYAGIADAKIISMLYNEDLSFPTAKVLSAINDKTKIIVVVNPNNPTGTPVKRADIIKILEKSKSAKNSIVLLDEAYHHFTKETGIDLIGKYENLIVVQTFSKVFGLAGLRIGYIISSEQNIRNIKKACSPYSVNSIAVLAASAALDDENYIEWYVSEVEKSRELLYQELKKLGIKAYPSSANFILAYFGNKSKEIMDKLKQDGILIRDRSSDKMLNGCIRISLGTVEQTKKFLGHLKTVL